MSGRIVFETWQAQKVFQDIRRRQKAEIAAAPWAPYPEPPEGSHATVGAACTCHVDDTCWAHSYWAEDPQQRLGISWEEFQADATLQLDVPVVREGVLPVAEAARSVDVERADPVHASRSELDPFCSPPGACAKYGIDGCEKHCRKHCWWHSKY